MSQIGDMLPQPREELGHQTLEDLREGHFQDATGVIRCCYSRSSSSLVGGKQDFLWSIKLQGFKDVVVTEVSLVYPEESG